MCATNTTEVVTSFITCFVRKRPCLPVGHNKTLMLALSHSTAHRIIWISTSFGQVFKAAIKHDTYVSSPDQQAHMHRWAEEEIKQDLDEQ